MKHIVMVQTTDKDIQKHPELAELQTIIKEFSAKHGLTILAFARDDKRERADGFYLEGAAHKDQQFMLDCFGSMIQREPLRAFMEASLMIHSIKMMQDQVAASLNTKQ